MLEVFDKNHKIGTYETNKTTLLCFVDKINVSMTMNMMD